MKQTSLFLLILLTLFNFSVKGEEIIGNSKITDVTVYLSGARVNRTGSAKIVPGNSTIVFQNLSDNIDPNSIEVVTTGNFNILGVSFGINELRMLSKPETIMKLEASYDSAVLKLSYLRNEKLAVEGQLKVLDANRQLGVNQKTIFLEEMDDWLELYRRRCLDINNKLTRIIEQEKEVSSTADKIKKQLNRFNSSQKIASGEIRVQVQSTKYENAEIKLTYFVNNAKWEPIYSLRAGKLTDPIRLDYDAQVSQTTGEEWKDVKLLLSSGNPMLGGNKPTITPWFVAFAEPIVYPRNSRNKGGDMMAPAMMMKSEDVMSEGASSDVMKEQSIIAFSSVKATSVIFEIALKYSVMPDGLPQQVRIQQTTLPALFEYSSIPKFDEDAFLECKITGWEELNLLSGNANLFIEGMYVGKSFIDPTSTSDTFTLSFGRDKKLNVKRLRVMGTGGKQLSGSSKKETFSYEITVKNLKSSPVTIKIDDQIPISQSKGLEIDLKENSEAKYEKESGKLTWRLNLKENEVKKLRFTYIVTYPKNRYIQNLY